MPVVYLPRRLPVCQGSCRYADALAVRARGQQAG